MKYLFIFLIYNMFFCSDPSDGAGSRTQPAPGEQQKNFADLTGPWQLMVDDYIIEKKQNLKRVYYSFDKHPGNPVLVPEKPWEGNLSYAYGTVLPDEDQKGYRLWYHAWIGEYTNLYATSRDGLSWEKPELNIIEFKGSKANNLFLARTKEDHLPQVIYTPWEKDPQKKYKLINYDYGRTKPDHLVSGYWGAYSSDGIHWKDADRNPVLKDLGDVGNFVWDPHTKQYTGYPKIFVPVRGFNRRCVGYTATKDFENWPSAQFILEPDEVDDHWSKKSYQRTEFYGLTAFAYESGYIGFLWIFHLTDGLKDGPIFCELVSSHDGINWIRQEPTEGRRSAVLGTGPKGSWDQGMVFTTNHPLVENDVIKLWYGAMQSTHGIHRDTDKSGIGYATMRKDGFASLKAGKMPGSLITYPLKGLQGQLYINANAAHGDIRVEVLNTEGQALPGYSINDCETIIKDSTKILVKWKKHDQLPVQKSSYRLRFVLEDAELFSFRAALPVERDFVEKDAIHINFDNDQVNEEPAKYLVHGNVAVVKDGPAQNRVATFPEKIKDSTARIELLNTTHLGPEFTLMAEVKTRNKGLTRLFSNYRGSGEPVTGELIFDFDASGKEHPGMRLIINGQTALSDQLRFDDDQYHQLAVTYENGEVIFYLDGKQSGKTAVKLGAAHLFSDRTVRPYFESPEALPQVGIHLGNNLYAGGDLTANFSTYKDNVKAGAKAVFRGNIKTIFIGREALAADEIEKMYSDRQSSSK